MKRSLLTSFAIVSLSVMPLVTRAADACPTTPGNLKDLICMAMELVNPIIALLTGIAVLYFIWNVVRFIAKASDEKSRASAKDGILYGVIGLFVLFSFWGLVELLRASVFG
jgi:hypothetical protein